MQGSPSRGRGLFRGVATPPILCHKEPTGLSSFLYAGSLWHKIAGEAIPRSNPRHRGGPV